MLAEWFARDPVEFIMLGLLVLAIPVVAVVVLVYYIRARLDPVEPKQEKVVRHLLGKGFVCCDVGGFIIWPIDLEIEDTVKLRALLKKPGQDPKEVQAKLVECYEDKGLCGIVDRHVVRVSRGQSGMFSTDEGPERVELWVYLDQLNDHKDFDAKLALRRDCSSDDSEKGASPFDSGHDGFDAFFTERVASPRAADLFKAAGDKLDGVTRFASKWGEKLDYIQITKHIRLGLAAEVVLDAEDPGSVLDAIMEDAVALGVTIEAALDPSFVATRHVWVEDPLYVRAEVLGTCSKCKAGAPLNGPSRRYQCSNCLSDQELDDDLWDLLEHPRDDFLQGYGGVSTGWGGDSTRLDWRVESPRCAGCEAELPVDNVEVGTTGVVRCDACGAETPTAPAPEWLREVLPGIEQLYGAEGIASTGDGTAIVVDQKADKPVVMSCPGCGGSLTLTSASERTVNCGYCSMDVFLPDELWKKLHPVKVVRPWWVRFAPCLPMSAGEN